MQSPPTLRTRFLDVASQERQLTLSVCGSSPIYVVPASAFALGEQCDSLLVNLHHRCWLDNKLRYVKQRPSRNAIGWASLVKAERLAFLALSSCITVILILSRGGTIMS